MLESVLNQVLQAQATEQLRAESYERTEERKGYRNGTYPHQLYSGRHHYASRPPDSRLEVLNGATSHKDAKCPASLFRREYGILPEGIFTHKYGLDLFWF